jgi:hypothetical protein
MWQSMEEAAPQLGIEITAGRAVGIPFVAQLVASTYALMRRPEVAV